MSDDLPDGLVSAEVPLAWSPGMPLVEIGLAEEPAVKAAEAVEAHGAADVEAVMVIAHRKPRKDTVPEVKAWVVELIEYQKQTRLRALCAESAARALVRRAGGHYSKVAFGLPPRPGWHPQPWAA